MVANRFANVIPLSKLCGVNISWLVPSLS